MTPAWALLIVGFVAFAIGSVGAVREWRSPSTVSPLVWGLPVAAFCAVLACGLAAAS